MARNCEKAQAMLNRWYAFKDQANARPNEKRPHMTSICDNIKDGERWRMQVVKEISRKVTEIQNGTLGEYKIRDLNDEINKLIRERKHWDRRIRELGGPDYQRIAYDSQAEALAEGTIIGVDGYYYFGAARNLSGVRELLAKQVDEKKDKRKRFELYKAVDFDYYGYRDDDDGLLKKLEKKADENAKKRIKSKKE